MFKCIVFYWFSLTVFGKALLQCLSCILPFLDKDLIDNLPYLVSSTISVLPPALHQDIVNALCYYILPFTISMYLLIMFLLALLSLWNSFQHVAAPMSRNAKPVSQFPLSLWWSCSTLKILVGFKAIKYAEYLILINSNSSSLSTLGMSHDP